MCYHHHISLYSNHSSSPAAVRLDDMLLEEGIFDVRLIYRTEYGRFKLICFGIIELFEVCNGLLLLILKVYETVSLKIKLKLV